MKSVQVTLDVQVPETMRDVNDLAMGNERVTSAVILATTAHQTREAVRQARWMIQAAMDRQLRSRETD